MLDERDEHEPRTASEPCFEVTIKGEIDLGRCDELMDIVELYEGGSDVDVLIDLSAVTFMDSTGLGALAQLSRLARDRGGKVTVQNVAPRVEKVMRMTQLDHVIDVATGDVATGGVSAGGVDAEVIDLTATGGTPHAAQ